MTMTAMQHHERAEHAQHHIEAIKAAGEYVAQAHARVQTLADGRALEKSAAIRRLMQTNNEETGKPHSANSAEKVVELDADFLAYRNREREAEIERWRSLAAFEAAKLVATLAVESFAVWGRHV